MFFFFFTYIIFEIILALWLLCYRDSVLCYLWHVFIWPSRQLVFLTQALYSGFFVMGTKWNFYWVLSVLQLLLCTFCFTIPCFLSIFDHVNNVVEKFIICSLWCVIWSFKCSTGISFTKCFSLCCDCISKGGWHLPTNVDTHIQSQGMYIQQNWGIIIFP